MAHITVEAGGQTLQLDLAVGDIRRFEKEYQITLGDLQLSPGQDAPPGHLDKMLFLAWCAAKRCKHTELAFDDWCDTIESLGGVEADPLDRSTAEPPSS
jgi:hypothetical protein